MKPNKQEILECISSMKSVCADGRREIKDLVTKIIGEPLEDEIDTFKAGDVFESRKGSTLIVIQWGNDEFIFNGLRGNPLEAYSDEPRHREAMIKRLREMGAKKIGQLKAEIIRS